MTTKNELIELVRELQTNVGTKVNAASTLNSKTKEELQDMIEELAAVTPVHDKGSDHASVDVINAAIAAGTNTMSRNQCIAALRAAGYTGPVSYLVPRLRELVLKHA